MTLKEQILDLKQQGIKQNAIARKLDCSTGTVSYHCNPEVKKNIITKKRLRRKQQKPQPHPYLNKEIEIEIKEVNWKHAEIICNARLIELGYDTFIPSVSGGEIDLIAHKDNKVYRIQIKSSTPKKSHLSISMVRRSINYNNSKTKPYKYIDWFLIYDGTNIYKIEASKVNEAINLRYRVPINDQVNNIHMASDYIL